MFDVNWKRWLCTRCNCEFKEHELVSTCVDAGDRLQPPEYDSKCPQCGAPSEHHTEVPLCESCEDEYPLEDERYCAPCMTDYAESVMEDR